MMQADYAKKAKTQFTKTVVKILKIVGTALAIMNGFIQPLSSLVYGELTDDLMIPSGNKNMSSNRTEGNNSEQNVTKSSINLLGGSNMTSTLMNNTGTQKQRSQTNGQLLNNLKILQNASGSISGNNSHPGGIPTRLVLTPETDPLHPPGYGYPIMPGLIRLRPQQPTTATKDKLSMVSSLADQEKRISKYALYYCYLALATFICSYGQMISWNIASSKFFQEKQDGYEKLAEEDFDDENKKKRKLDEDKEDENESDDSIGSKIAVLIQNAANFASSMLVSFLQNWQLTLMMLVVGPVMASVMIYMNKLKTIALEKVKFLMQRARGVAQGAFAQVQTVAAFGGQDFEKKKFSSSLLAADKAAKIRSIVDAVRAGIMIVIAFIFLGIGFWFSAGLILNGTLTPGAFISNKENYDDGNVSYKTTLLCVIEWDYIGKKINDFTHSAERFKIFMAIISSVLKLVNVGDTIKVDNANDNKNEEKFLSSSESKEADNGRDVIGRILEHLSNPDEVFQFYPSRPESMLKSTKEQSFEDNVYIQLYSRETRSDRCNMSGNNLLKSFGEANRSNNLPINEDKEATRTFCKQWNVKKFKDKIKSKFQSKKNDAMYKDITNPETDCNLRNTFSVEKIKESSPGAFKKFKSWIETKVLGQVRKREMSLEVVKLQIKQLPLIVLSLVGAVMTGMIAPGFSLLLSEILIVTASPERLKTERLKWALKFVDLGVFIAIGSTVQKFSTSLSESRMEMGMKENAFNSAMNESEVPRTATSSSSLESPRQSEESLFKPKKESISGPESSTDKNDWDYAGGGGGCGGDEEKDQDKKTKLTEKDLNLLDGPSNVQAEKMTKEMNEDALNSLKSSFSLSTLTAKVSGSISTIMTMFISFTNGWKMTLVVLAGLPIIAYAQSVQNSEPAKETKEDNGILSKLWGKVRGLTSEASNKVPVSKYTSKYSDDCLKPYRFIVRTLIATGLAFAIAECTTFLVYAGALRYGGYLVRVGEMTVESVMTVLMTVLFGGAGSSNAPSGTSRTKNETAEKDELDNVKVTDSFAGDEKPVKLDDVNGELQFHNVDFHRPEKRSVLLSGLNISVKPQETLAIVGTRDFSSNAVIALVERFYDPTAGSITLDRIDIRSTDVKWLRSQMALVSEARVLHHHSVADNLLIADNTKTLSNDYLEDVSKITRLHDVINSLPKTYDTMIDDESILSNITKQKLAMTRVIIRNPRILIIDEFSQTTEDVEATLRNLCHGRTCIAFARHLSTLEKADKVVIVCHGRVVEQGPRDELLRTRGILYHLLNTRLHSDIAPEL